MKKTMILLLAAALLVGTTGCNRPGTASTDTSVVSDDGGSAGNSSVTESTKSTAVNSPGGRSNHSTVSTKTSDTVSQLVVPTELQKTWDSLSENISDKELVVYNKVAKEKGFTEKVVRSKIHFMYGFDDKPYWVLITFTNGELVIDRVSGIEMLGTAPDSKNFHVLSKYSFKKLYFSGASGWYHRDENGDFQHVIASYKKVSKDNYGHISNGLKQMLILFYEESLKNK